MNNFNILGESSFENPYPSVIVAPDFATNIYPSINTAITNSSIQQPFPGTFIATDFESQTQNSINDTLQKINNFLPSTVGDTTVSGIINTDTIKVNEIFDPTGTSTLQFSTTYIGILGANLQTNGNNITQVNDITANRFIVDNGTNIQYLLADGSTITQSANSGNSNFYLYTSINTSNAPPITAGNVEYNNVNQSLATFVYISHLTRDNIDIEIFFQNVSTLNILYLQDQNDSTNYIRYDITGNAIIVANSYISVPVAVIDSGGTGSTTFGASHNILISIFTNTQETNTRLSAVETKTQNQTAVSGTTTFASIILPTTTNTYDLGSTTNRFNNAYVNNLYNSSNYNVMKQRTLYIQSVPLTIYNLTSSTNPAVYQDATPSANGIINGNNILANTLEVGSSFSFTVGGTSTGTVAGDRVGIGLYVNSTVVAGTGSGGVNAVGTVTMRGEVVFTINTIGSVGTLTVYGGLTFRTGANTVLMTAFNNTGVAINTTINNMFKLALLTQSTGAVGVGSNMAMYSLSMKQLY